MAFLTKLKFLRYKKWYTQALSHTCHFVSLEAFFDNKQWKFVPEVNQEVSKETFGNMQGISLIYNYLISSFSQ